MAGPRSHVAATGPRAGSVPAVRHGALPSRCLLVIAHHGAELQTGSLLRTAGEDTPRVSGRDVLDRGSAAIKAPASLYGDAQNRPERILDPMWEWLVHPCPGLSACVMMAGMRTGIEDTARPGGEVVAATWICVRRRRLLVVRPAGQSVFYLPGGTPEPGESWERTASREVAEEVGMVVDPAGLTLFSQVLAPAYGSLGTAVRLVCFEGQGYGEPVADSEIEEIAWFGGEDLERCWRADPAPSADGPGPDRLTGTATQVTAVAPSRVGVPGRRPVTARR